MNDFWLTLQRIDARAVVDILLVTAVFFILLQLLRGTRAVQLLRGVIFFIVIAAILASTLHLEAVNWLISWTWPTLGVALPVIFQPELRRALERLGRAGSLLTHPAWEDEGQDIIKPIVQTAERLSEKRTGMLVVLERSTGLREYIDTGVPLGAKVTPELLMTIFFKDTLLHDGAVIVRAGRIAAAGCVLPLSTGPGLTDRQMGLRHRAALGVSEISDAVAVLVSEETGQIAVAHNGRMIRRLDANRLESVLRAFQGTRLARGWSRWVTFLRRPASSAAATPGADVAMLRPVDTPVARSTDSSSPRPVEQEAPALPTAPHASEAGFNDRSVAHTRAHTR